MRDRERERELMLNTEDPSTRNNNEQPRYRMVLAISAQKNRSLFVVLLFCVLSSVSLTPFNKKSVGIQLVMELILLLYPIVTTVAFVHFLL